MVILGYHVKYNKWNIYNHALRSVASKQKKRLGEECIFEGLVQPCCSHSKIMFVKLESLSTITISITSALVFLAVKDNCSK